MGTEESIIYSYDLATVPSVLPAFANARDLLVCDEVCGPPPLSPLPHPRKR
jgi:7-keto-8-aminopelargonate synthetase-like enzyme